MKYKNIVLTNPQSFIGSFEGDSYSPYLDSNGKPTISVGINIQAQIEAPITVKPKKGKPITVTPITPLGQSLAVDVRTYKHLPAKDSDLSVLNLLQSQATKHNWTRANQGPAFISRNDDKALFSQAFSGYLAKAQASIGGISIYNSLGGGYIQTALVDIAYNHGSVYSDMASDLTGTKPDYVLAGFDMLNQGRSQTIYKPNSAGFVTRLEAEYENLLIEHKDQLGTVVEGS